MTITIPTKPTAFRFAWNNPSERSSLTLAEQESGYDVALMKPSRKKFNYMFYTVGEWTQYLSSGGASIQFLDNEDPITTIEAIEDIDISNVESGAWLYGKAGIYTFYPLQPTPPSSTEYIIKPTTPLVGNMGAWILTIPNMDTIFGLAQEEVDRVESKLDSHIETTLTEFDSINIKLGNVKSILVARAMPNTAYTGIGANTEQTQAFTITGLDTTKKYNINVTPETGLDTHIQIQKAVVTATNTLSLTLYNNDGGTITPTSQYYNFSFLEI